MGCGGSKSDDLPLVIRCRERKELIKAAADHRYALAAAHVAYFRSLTGVGDALRRFVDEELVLVSPSASPVLTLPSDEGKTPSRKNKSRSINHNHSSSSPTSLSHSGSGSHIQLSDDEHDHEHHHDGEGSHLDLSSDSDSDLGSSGGHIHVQGRSGAAEGGGPSYSSQPPQTDWGSYGMNPPRPGPSYSNLPPQTDWGSYGGMNQPPGEPHYTSQPPQSGWGSYGGMNKPPEEPHYTSQPPQSGWGSYGMNQPPQTGWGSYGAYPPPPQSGWGPYGGGNSPPYSAWNQYGTNTSTTQTYYMKKSSPQVQSVIYDPTKSQTMGQVPESSYSYVNSYQNYPYENGGGFFGYPMRSPPRQPAENKKPSPPKGPPPPPSPKASSWDFLNPFEGYDSGYPGYYSHSNRYDAGSIASSPDSNEVREREGIPDLEDETETETYRDIRKGKNLYEDVMKNSGEGTSRAVPSQKQSSEGSSWGGHPHKQQDSEGSSRRPHKQQDSEGSSRTLPSEEGSIEDITRDFPSENSEGTSRKVPSQNSARTQSNHVKEMESSSDSIISKSAEEESSSRKKGVTFEVDAVSMQEAESSKLSSLTAFSVHGTRDLQEVVAEIRDEFAMASSYGKEVAMLLEVGKLPYAPKFTLLKVILSRILGTAAPSLPSSPSTSRRSVKLAYRTMRLAKSYYGENWKNSQGQPIDLSSTLEKLYVWEKRLYKEVKDEERLRVLYEKMCNRLKHLDDQGAETTKIEATQTSIRKLLTKLNVCIKAVDAISSRIHKLRDEELQPQVTELIYGLIRMWKTMLRCHQKQFQAIRESKVRSLIANSSSGSLRATLELESELRAWSGHFVDWIKMQKSFITSLNEWLLRCIFHEPEETPDGPVPFSPGRIGAPPVFVICHDWSQAMGNITEDRVAEAMRTFASSLVELLETQGEEQKQRLKAEFLSKDFERRLKTRRMERGRGDRDQETMSDKTGGSLVPSESGISPLDDLKVDLDSMRKRMEEERSRHKEATRLVHTATSSSLQGGLVPIFEALGSFTSDALKAYEHVRVQSGSEPPERN